MIQVDNQYTLTLTINGMDILDLKNFKEAAITERAGTELPTASIYFNTASSEIVDQLIEKNKVTMALGKDETNVWSSDFTIFKPTVQRASEDLWAVELILIKDTSADWHQKGLNLGEQAQTSLERLQTICPEDYPITTTLKPEQFADSMVWYQSNVSLKHHIEDIWYHSLMNDEDYMLLAATLSGFKIVSVQELTKQDYKYIIAPENEARDPKTYVYDNTKSSNTLGQTTKFGSRGADMNVLNLVTGEHELISSEPKFLFGSGDIPFDADLYEVIHYPTQVLSRNQHESYWSAYIDNCVQFLFNSSYTVAVTFRNRYVPFELLDFVLYKEDDVRSSKNEAAQYKSGLGIITKVVHGVIGRKFSTSIEISFASLNKE